MFANYGPIFALLRGTAFLLAANGLHGLLMPLRGQAEGFSATQLGLLGTGWAGGFITGCIFAPRLVRSVGHVRAFSAFAASAAAIVLMTGLVVDPLVWIGLRVMTGFVMAGAFMVIESWLNEASTNENRGTVFSLYMMVTFSSIMGGQMLVAVGKVTNETLFMVAAIFFCLSLLPTTMSTVASPRPLSVVSLDLNGLYRNSPVAFIGCFLVGVANGGWGTLGAVYGAQIELSTAQIALMMSVTVAAGALLQLPAGRLSDRIDRRIVIVVMAALACLFGLVVFSVAPRAATVVIAMTALYGAAAYTLYSLSVAHANDHAGAEDFVKVSGGLLLLYGFGTMAGPILGAGLMELMRPESLFLATAAAHGGIVIYTVIRISRRAAPSQAEKDEFHTMPAERAVTPEALRLDPRGEEE